MSTGVKQLAAAVAVVALLIAGLALAMNISRTEEAQRVGRERIERERAADEARRAAPPSAPPRELVVWDWVGRIAWPALSEVNDACAPMARCADLRGSERAACWEERVPRCRIALDALEATEMPPEVDGLFAYRLASERAIACAYEVNARAHRAQPRALDRLRPGDSTEVAIDDAVHRSPGGRWRRSMRSSPPASHLTRSVGRWARRRSTWSSTSGAAGPPLRTAASRGAARRSACG